MKEVKEIKGGMQVLRAGKISTSIPGMEELTVILMDSSMDDAEAKIIDKDGNETARLFFSVEQEKIQGTMPLEVLSCLDDQGEITVETPDGNSRKFEVEDVGCCCYHWVLQTAKESTNLTMGSPAVLFLPLAALTIFFPE